jgi:putative redox protein
MSTSKVIYLGELRTNAEHLASKSTIITDAPPDNHGRGEAFSPTDLAATSLASCMLTVLGIYAGNNGVDMKGSHAEVTKIMSKEGSRRIVRIELMLHIITREMLDEKGKEIFERIARTCPVALSLHPDIIQDIQVDFSSNQAGL